VVLDGHEAPVRCGHRLEHPCRSIGFME
jgi:hypothetical protein